MPDEILAPVPSHITQKLVQPPYREDFFFAVRYRRMLSNGELTHVLAYLSFDSFRTLVLEAGGISPEAKWETTNW